MKKYLSCLALTTVLASCGGSGGGGSETPTASVPDTFTGQAILGPIVNATVTVYKVGEYQSPLCTVSTSDSTVLSEAGLITLEESCIAADSMHLLVVSGGADIDADDDGVVDQTPTPLNGEIHALLTAEQIRQQQWNVNVLSDIAYYAIRNLLSVDTGMPQLSDELDSIAKRLLADELNNDGNINYNDLLDWSPRTDQASLAVGSDRVAAFVSGLHAGDRMENLAADLSDPTPRDFSLQTTELVSISIQGKRAYTCGRDIVEVHDISDPTNTTTSGQFVLDTQTPAPFFFTRCSTTDDGFVYWATTVEAGQYELNILDFQNLQGPMLAAQIPISIDTDNIAVETVVEGNLLIVNLLNLKPTYGASSLLIYDISDRSSPQQLAILPVDGLARLFIEDNIAYLALWSGKLLVVDISNPAFPDPIGEYSFSGQGSGIAVSGDIAYLSILDDAVSPPKPRLITLDISDKQAIEPIGDPLSLNFDSIWLTQINDSHLFGLGYDNDPDFPGLSTRTLVEISLLDPRQPRLISLESDYAGLDVRLYGNYLYAGTQDNKFSVSPVVNSVPDYIGFIATPKRAIATAVVGNTALIAASRFDGEVIVADISNPSSPVKQSTINNFAGLTGTSYVAGSYFFDNETAVVSIENNQQSGLWFYDISDPEAPVYINNFALPDEPEDVLIQGNTAYIATNYSGLIIADLSDLSSPSQIGTTGPDNLIETSTLDIAGNYLYFMDDSVDMKIVDIADPTTPAIIGNYDSPFFEDGYFPIDISIVGSTAFLIQLDIVSIMPDFTVRGQLEVVDISVPDTPEFVSTLETSGQSEGVSAENGLAFVSDRQGAIDVIDVSDPVMPRLLYSLSVPSEIFDISHDDHYIYASADSGLFILKRPVHLDIP